MDLAVMTAAPTEDRSRPMRRIPLRARDGSVRAYALVDDEDFEWLNQWRWSLSSEGYARRRDPHAYMQRIVLERSLGRGLVREELAHHRNEIRLDNQRRNLVPRTALQHKAEHHPNPGVRYNRQAARRKRWLARPTVGGRKVYLGHFETKREAVEACRAAT